MGTLQSSGAAGVCISPAGGGLVQLQPQDETVLTLQLCNTQHVLGIADISKAVLIG